MAANALPFPGMTTDLQTDLRQSATDCVQRGIAALRSLQNSDGHWCGLLQGDSILESEYLLMKFILGQENDPMRDGTGRETLAAIAAGLRRQQRADGTWGQYPGADMDLSATVKGYFALKPHGRCCRCSTYGSCQRGGSRSGRR